MFYIQPCLVQKSNEREGDKKKMKTKIMFFITYGALVVGQHSAMPLDRK